MKNKKSKKDRLWKENGNICAHCGHRIYSSYNKTIDHFIPKSCFGSYDFRNLFPLCRNCNEEKGHKLVGLGFYAYCSEYKKQMAMEYGQEFSRRYSSLG